MSFITSLILWFIGAVILTVAIKASGRFAPTPRAQEWVWDSGYVSIFGYIFMATILILSLDYYLG